MLKQHEFPIMEFDDASTAKLNPASFGPGRFSADKLVITFFPEVMDRLRDRGLIEKEQTIPGENPVDIYRFSDDPGVLITLGQVGCPACAGNLDLFHEMGVEKVMFCGGGGVLDGNIEVGQILLVDGAIRDEGFSYHYLPPSRVVHTDRATTDAIAAFLEEEKVSYLRGLTWTTDAIFRETVDRIERRKGEGARIVEMEQAGCIAVAMFRGFTYGALIYGGDDLSGEEWSNRGWRSREGVRYDLVMLCRRLLYRI
ncbi:MAG: nucleoside phosphorylase [Lachnospiraceae bacterium]|nr:nucleoside phosphorylase [Lachnospiraceae bacterium]